MLLIYIIISLLILFGTVKMVKEHDGYVDLLGIAVLTVVAFIPVLNIGVLFWTSHENGKFDKLEEFLNKKVL